MGSFSVFRTIGFIMFAAAILILPGACQWTKPFKPLSPTVFRSSQLSRMGNAAMEQGDWEEAEKRLDEAVKLNKKDTELRRHYAEALWIRGKRDEALEQLNEAIRRGGSDNALLNIALAEKYLILDNPQSAHRFADKAVSLAPREYRGWALRGKANWLLAEMESRKNPAAPIVSEQLYNAKNDYYRALSLSPDNRDLLPELAAIQMRCRQPEHALATWQHLERFFPKDSVPADLLRGKAESYVALGQINEALNCLHQARRIEPESPEIERRLQEIVALAHRQVY